MSEICAPERDNVEPQLNDKNDREGVFKSVVDFVENAFGKGWSLGPDEVEAEV